MVASGLGLPTSVVVLPPELKGYARYVVVLDPDDKLPYSVGIRYVRPSKGMERMFQLMISNKARAHRKHIQAWLCRSALDGTECPQAESCNSIHVTEEGMKSRRLWTQPNKAARTVPPDDSETVDPLPSQDSDSPPRPRSAEPARRPDDAAPPPAAPQPSHRPPSSKNPGPAVWGTPSTSVDSLSAPSSSNDFVASPYTPFLPSMLPALGFPNPVEQMQLAAKMAELRTAQQRAMELSSFSSKAMPDQGPSYDNQPTLPSDSMDRGDPRAQAVQLVLEDLVRRAQVEVGDLSARLQAAEQAKALAEQQAGQVFQQLHATSLQVEDLQERLRRAEANRDLKLPGEDGESLGTGGGRLEEALAEARELRQQVAELQTTRKNLKTQVLETTEANQSLMDSNAKLQVELQHLTRQVRHARESEERHTTNARTAEKEAHRLQKQLQDLERNQPNALRALDAAMAEVAQALEAAEGASGLGRAEQDALLQLRLDHWSCASAQRDLQKDCRLVDRSTELLQERVARLRRSVQDLLRKDRRERSMSRDPTKKEDDSWIDKDHSLWDTLAKMVSADPLERPAYVNPRAESCERFSSAALVHPAVMAAERKRRRDAEMPPPPPKRPPLPAQPHRRLSPSRSPSRSRSRSSSRSSSRSDSDS